MTFRVCCYQKKISQLCPLQGHDLKGKLRNFQSAIHCSQKWCYIIYIVKCIHYNSIRCNTLSIILLMHKAQYTSSSLQFSLVVYIPRVLFKLDITLHLRKSIINFTVPLQLICRHTAYSQQ